MIFRTLALFFFADRAPRLHRYDPKPRCVFQSLERRRSWSVKVRTATRFDAGSFCTRRFTGNALLRWEAQRPSTSLKAMAQSNLAENPKGFFGDTDCGTASAVILARNFRRPSKSLRSSRFFRRAWQKLCPPPSLRGKEQICPGTRPTGTST